jgi:hypothetical protein
MANPSASAQSFLREAFTSYAAYITPQKQEVQKKALKWLQTRIKTDLEDKTILEQFAQKWRSGSTAETAGTLSLDLLPSSYKGKKSIDGHQEDALAFLQANIPLSLQEEFKKHWEIKTKLEVSNSAGTSFKVDDREIGVLQAEDADGNGTTWYPVPKKQVYYLLSSELQGTQYLVVLDEEISPHPRDTWYVAQEDIKISNL